MSRGILRDIPQMKDTILLYYNIHDANDNVNYSQFRLINYLSLTLLGFEQQCPVLLEMSATSDLAPKL